MSDKKTNIELFQNLFKELKALNMPVVREEYKHFNEIDVYAKVYLTMDEELIKRTNVRTRKRLSGPVLEFFCKTTGRLVNAYHLSQIFGISMNTISSMVRYSLRISSIFDNICSKQNLIPEFVKIAFFMDDQDIKIFIMETNYGINKNSGPGY